VKKLLDLLNVLESYFIYKNDDVLSSVSIAGIAIDSREDVEGKLFVAEKGFKFDGVKFVEGAIKDGAVAVIVQEGSEEKLVKEAIELIENKKVPLIVVPNTSIAVSEICNEFYDVKPKYICGITGTNGKTTIVDFTRQIWSELGVKAASMGTIGLQVSFDSPKIRELIEFVDGKGLTTLDVVSTHYVLSELKKEGVDYVAMETSSNGLEQRRCDLPFVAGGFSSFEIDHLDFHDGIEGYFSSKKILFNHLIVDGGFAVVNNDMNDFAGISVVEDLIKVSKERGLNLVRYGKTGEDVKILFEEVRDGKIYSAISFFGKEFDLVFPMNNHYMFLSALNAAIFAYATLGKGRLDDIVFALENLKDVNGRFEFVGNAKSGASIYVDYAHNGEAIRNILQEAKDKVAGENGKVISVIGGAGEKPKERLQELAKYSVEYSDVAVLTTDSPRSENPNDIVKKMLEISPSAVGIINRIVAVGKAIELSGNDDVIVICGKGHEKTISLAGKDYYISDKQIVEYLLEGKADDNLKAEMEEYNSVIG
jgi:UDP-N-acetylmuramoyl-L-alanyl-D-glutamate--2,6-diaminopimelate ligase